MYACGCGKFSLQGFNPLWVHGHRETYGMHIGHVVATCMWNTCRGRNDLSGREVPCIMKACTWKLCICEPIETIMVALLTGAFHLIATVMCSVSSLTLTHVLLVQAAVYHNASLHCIALGHDCWGFDSGKFLTKVLCNCTCCVHSIDAPAGYGATSESWWLATQQDRQDGAVPRVLLVWVSRYQGHCLADVGPHEVHHYGPR